MNNPLKHVRIEIIKQFGSEERGIESKSLCWISSIGPISLKGSAHPAPSPGFGISHTTNACMPANLAWDILPMYTAWSRWYWQFLHNQEFLCTHKQCRFGGAEAFSHLPSASNRENKLLVSKKSLSTFPWLQIRSIKTKLTHLLALQHSLKKLWECEADVQTTFPSNFNLFVFLLFFASTMQQKGVGNSQLHSYFSSALLYTRIWWSAF